MLHLFATKTTEAALVTINPDGEVVWNVLSLQDDLLANREVEDFSVRKVAEVNNAGNDLINVEQVDGKVKLSVGSGESVKQIDIEQTDDSLIEIEERPALQKLTIGKTDDKFTINQRNTTVDTQLPIQVNPKSARLSFRTSKGENFLYVYPEEAIMSVYRSKVATNIRQEENLELLELDKRLVYKVPGEKVIPILNIYNYKFDVDTYISAQSGELIEVSAPTWYKIFGFLITQQV